MGNPENYTLVDMMFETRFIFATLDIINQAFTRMNAFQLLMYALLF